MKPTPEGIRVGNETKDKKEAGMNPRTGNETKANRNPQIRMKSTLEGIREWRETETTMKPTPEEIRVGKETKR